MSTPLKLYHLGEALVAALMREIGSSGLRRIVHPQPCMLLPSGDIEARENVALCPIVGHAGLFPAVDQAYKNSPGSLGAPTSYQFDGQGRIDVAIANENLALAWEVKLGETYTTWTTFQSKFLSNATGFNRKPTPRGGKPPTPTPILPIISGGVPVVLQDYANGSSVFYGASPSDSLYCEWDPQGALPLARGLGLVVRDTLFRDMVANLQGPLWPPTLCLLSFEQLARQVQQHRFDEIVWRLIGLERLSFYKEWI